MVISYEGTFIGASYLKAHSDSIQRSADSAVDLRQCRDAAEDAASVNEPQGTIVSDGDGFPVKNKI